MKSVHTAIPAVSRTRYFGKNQPERVKPMAPTRWQRPLCVLCLCSKFMQVIRLDESNRRNPAMFIHQVCASYSSPLIKAASNCDRFLTATHHNTTNGDWLNKSRKPLFCEVGAVVATHALGEKAHLCSRHTRSLSSVLILIQNHIFPECSRQRSHFPEV